MSSVFNNFEPYIGTDKDVEMRQVDIGTIGSVIDLEKEENGR